MIILACDHAGYLLKEQIKEFFNKENITTIDVGTYSTESVDYPDYVKAGNQKVLENSNNVGIYICGTGIGMCIAANKNPKIRAALCSTTNFASLARKHNNANVLVLPGRYINKAKAIRIIKIFLTTTFEGGRHARRIKKLKEI
ncbi:MAG: ribose 5-phosphate isomerase B [Clostridiales bacterium]|nr:ribose 5-phosphate isomerase B [Clostridiales bacterium]